MSPGTKHPQDKAQATWAQMSSSHDYRIPAPDALQQLYIYRQLEVESVARTFNNFKSNEMRYLWVKWQLYEAEYLTKEELDSTVSPQGVVGPRGNGPVPSVYAQEAPRSYVPSPPAGNDDIDVEELFSSIEGSRVEELEGEDVD